MVRVLKCVLNFVVICRVFDETIKEWSVTNKRERYLCRKSWDFLGLVDFQLPGKGMGQVFMLSFNFASPQVMFYICDTISA